MGCELKLKYYSLVLALEFCSHFDVPSQVWSIKDGIDGNRCTPLSTTDERERTREEERGSEVGADRK